MDRITQPSSVKENGETRWQFYSLQINIIPGTVGKYYVILERVKKKTSVITMSYTLESEFWL